MKAKAKQPGDFLRYPDQRRRKLPLFSYGEILCHNRVARDGNGFRFFICKSGGDWELCSCGWMPQWGEHYRQKKHQCAECNAEGVIPVEDGLWMCIEHVHERIHHPENIARTEANFELDDFIESGGKLS